MTGRRPAPRRALALLERCVPDSAALAGDLLEEFERHGSRARFWWEVLAAIATGAVARSADIRPLRLVSLQPADALERTRRWTLRFRPVNLSASPLPGVGGLGLIVLACHLTLTRPGAWWVLLASALTGVLFGIVLTALHRKPPPRTTIRPRV